MYFCFYFAIALHFYFIIIIMLFSFIFLLSMSNIQAIPLPYAQNALEPHISSKAIDFHYNKHHATYVKNCGDLIAGTPYASLKLTDIILKSAKDPKAKAIFNNAAQIYNHNLFWLSMSPNGGGLPKGKLLEMIKDSFGDVETFIASFKELALKHFGSGWAWLSLDVSKNKLVLSATSNADSPLLHGLIPLLTVDVWEHAYYIDYQNRRKDYLDMFFDKLVNWEYASSLLH